jgi:hypothetical protein
MTDYFIFELKNREKKERKLLHIRKKTVLWQSKF